MINFDIADTGDLGFVQALCWRMLAEGASSRKCGMHQVVIGTSAGDMAILRTVILRRVETQTRKVYFHTDLRSAKVREIQASGMLSWLAYDPAQVSQIRLSGKTVIHYKDALCKEHWALTAHHSRRAYMLAAGPGIEISDPGNVMSSDLEAFTYTLEESESGFDNFAVVETTVDWMEWYYTHHTGNRRAVFQYESGELKKASWQTP